MSTEPWLQFEWGFISAEEAVRGSAEAHRLQVLSGREPRGPCYWCGTPTFKGVKFSPGRPQPKDTATRDHLLPLSLGGRGTRTVLACADCNSRRGSDITWVPWSRRRTLG